MLILRDVLGWSAKETAAPAIANYLRLPREADYSALALDVLRIEDGAIAEITAFPASVFTARGLPQKLPPPRE